MIDGLCVLGSGSSETLSNSVTRQPQCCFHNFPQTEGYYEATVISNFRCLLHRQNAISLICIIARQENGVSFQQLEIKQIITPLPKRPFSMGLITQAVLKAVLWNFPLSLNAPD